MALILIFAALAKRLAGKSISDMAHLVSSWTLNLNSVNQSSHRACMPTGPDVAITHGTSTR